MKCINKSCPLVSIFFAGLTTLFVVLSLSGIALASDGHDDVVDKPFDPSRNTKINAGIVSMCKSDIKQYESSIKRVTKDIAKIEKEIDKTERAKDKQQQFLNKETKEHKLISKEQKTGKTSRGRNLSSGMRRNNENILERLGKAVDIRNDRIKKANKKIKSLKRDLRKAKSKHKKLRNAHQKRIRSCEILQGLK